MEALKYADKGKGILTPGKHVLVETMHVCEEGYDIQTQTVINLLPRKLAVINAKVELKGKFHNVIYKVKSISVHLDQYLNLVVISVIHILTEHASTINPVVLANLSSEYIFV